MTIRFLLLILFGFNFGLMAAAGVFTVLVAIGLIPRFAGRTHTADKILLYEDMVIFGTLSGCIVSVFSRYLNIGAFLQNNFSNLHWLWNGGGKFLLIIFGLFSGTFIGCLALAIAEMLDSIPIFARRISFRHGIGIAILSVAAGKLFGSFFYFITQLHEVIK